MAQPERQELTQEQQELARKAHIAALAIAFGADEQQAISMASDVIANQQRFKNLKDELDGWEQKPYNRRRVEKLGSQFITDKTFEHWKFTVGARVLGLLREDVRSGTFTNLWDWVDAWTEGKRTQVYKNSLSKLRKQLALSSVII